MTDPDAPLVIEGLSCAPQGVFLNSAYTHPMSQESVQAIQDYLQLRREAPLECGDVMSAARTSALAAFAQMHGCQPDDLAFVSSTMAGENAVVLGLGLMQGCGRVVTDGGHFSGSLFLYHALRARGLDAEMAIPDAGETLLDAYERTITPGTTLVAVSAVSATTGHQLDLKALCEIAHARGALVYVDLIQAAGAVPLDLVGSGVDFAASATYKWLLGDFGVAVFYARPERLQKITEHLIGYRQISEYQSHYLPYDPPDGVIGNTWPIEAEMSDSVAGRVEVGTQAHTAIISLGTSLPRLAAFGLESIQRHRTRLLRRLAEELPRLGFEPMVSRAEALRAAGSVAAYAYPDAGRLCERLDARQISITVYRNRIRVSPSFFNSMQDIEALLEVLQ